MAVDASRIWTQEGAYSFLSSRLDEILKEIDSRLNGMDMHTSITRLERNIQKITYYTSQARTQILIERIFSYTNGFISTIESIFYNLEGGEDCRITEVATRDPITRKIISVDSSFTTTEDSEL